MHEEEKPIKVGSAPMVRVVFADSFQIDSGWHKLEDYAQADEIPEEFCCESVGYLVASGAKLTVIAPHVGRQHEGQPDSACGLMFIPTAAIIRTQVLEPTEEAQP